MDAFVSAGWYDPDAANAAERREFLEYLLTQGYTVDQICAAADGHTDESFFRIADLLAHPGPTFISAAELAERVGCDVEEVAEMRAALALPVTSFDAPEIAEGFVEHFRLYLFGCEAYGRDRTLGLMRVIGASVVAMTEAAREVAIRPTRETGATELEVAQTNVIATEAWIAAGRLVAHVMGAQLNHSLWFVTDLLRGEVKVAVAFVDLVGSTDWAAKAGSEASAALHRFEHVASSLALAHDARVVKFIGDEAMIVGRDAAAVAEVAARLCAAVASDDGLPAARGAVGWGVVTARSGDYFGDVVNLVARSTKEAAPNAIVVTADVAARLPLSRWELSGSRNVSLRGIDGLVELVDAGLGMS